MIITKQMYTHGREKKFASEYTDEIFNNSNKTIARASELLSRMGKSKVYVTSGWRSRSINASVGGSPNSQHIFGNAIDIADPDKSIGIWCMENIESLAEIGIWMESLTKTHASEDPRQRWVHWQTLPPKSGNRIFLP
jgi:hypothetical protein